MTEAEVEEDVDAITFDVLRRVHARATDALAEAEETLERTKTRSWTKSYVPAHEAIVRAEQARVDSLVSAIAELKL